MGFREANKWWVAPANYNSEVAVMSMVVTAGSPVECVRYCNGTSDKAVSKPAIAR